MDLVDIDKVLDELENLEQKSTRSAPQSASRPPAHRRIKVSSVLSSLNDYVDYDRKVEQQQPDVSTIRVDVQPSVCEQTTGVDNVNKVALIADSIEPAQPVSQPPNPATFNQPDQQEVKRSVVAEVAKFVKEEQPAEEDEIKSAKCEEVAAVLESEIQSIPTEIVSDCNASAASSSIHVSDKAEAENPVAAHVTESVSAPVKSPSPDDGSRGAGETREAVAQQNTEQIEIATVEPSPPAAVDEEEDLEKYLEALEMEFDKEVKVKEGAKAESSEGDRSKEEETEEVPKVESSHQQVELSSAISKDDKSDIDDPGTPENEVDSDATVELEACTASSPANQPGSSSHTKADESSQNPETRSKEDEEMDMNEIRELERLIEQQEKEAQMELDHQMALKLQQGDDTDLEPSLADSPPVSQADEAGDETASVGSPLEQPASNVRVMEEDPEYRYLISLGKVAPYWVPDSTHESCMQCDQKFSILKRRHHCRCCGELLCATCCAFRAQLEYMREQQQLLAASTSTSASSPTNDWPEARICTKCDALFRRRDELLQIRYLAECGIGEDSGLAEFPIKGVLKKPKPRAAAGGGEEDDGDTTGTDDNSDSTAATPTKTVIFSDGIRPGHDDLNEERSRRRSRTAKVVVVAPPEATATPAVAVANNNNHVNNNSNGQEASESEVVARALNNYKAFVTALKTFYNLQNQSYLPPTKTHLPPLLRNSGAFLPAVEMKNDFHSCQQLCDFLKSDRRDFLIQKRLYCAVKIIDYRIDANQVDNQCRWCLNITTNGMRLVGQDELVVLIEMNPDYFVGGSPDDKRNLKFLLLLLRRFFVHFNKIYMRIYSQLNVEMRAKRKMEVAQLQHPDPSFLLLDNRVAVSPFYYFNTTYVPPLGAGGASSRSVEVDRNGNESDESEKENYICDKYAFLKPKNQFVRSMDLLKMTFGTKGSPDFYLDFNAILYMRSTYQSTQGVILPDRSGGEVLFGLLVKHIEIPWAKLFPLRLLLRMGAEYQLYPWPVFNALDRKCLYSENVDNSIILFLADFRNFSFTLNEIPGLHMHMEHDAVLPQSSEADSKQQENVRVVIFLPKINYKRIEAMINDSSESILSFFGALNRKADGHLVCIQGDGSAKDASRSVGYSTQSLNIERADANAPSKTGLNFFILNGALKSASGLKAKMSIIEDGVMVQVLPPIMAQVRTALLEMRNFEIKCENIEEKVDPAAEKRSSPTEVISFVWSSAPIETLIGLKSEIDEKRLDNLSFVNMICDYHKKAEPGKPGQSSRGASGMFGLRSNSKLEMDCFYLHLHKVVLLNEENYFALFNDKMVQMPEGDESGTVDANANLIKSLNVSNWEVPSINFLIKLSALLGRIVDRALSKHYAKLYEEKLRTIGVRFHFEPEQIVTYEAGSLGTKLAMSFMNDMDTNLIPMLHHILELNAKDTPNVVQYSNKNSGGSGINSLGHNLNAEFLDRINLLQNLQRGVSFELCFDILIDLP